MIGGIGVRAALKDLLEHVAGAEQSAVPTGREARITQGINPKDSFYSALKSANRSNIDQLIKADCSALEDAMHAKLGV